MQTILNFNVQTAYGEAFVSLDKAATKLHDPTNGLVIEPRSCPHIPSVTDKMFYDTALKHFMNMYPEPSDELPTLSYTQASLVARKVVSHINNVVEFDSLAKA